MTDRVFISDLHLAPERPDIIQLFERFASEIASQADELYILGDFLEYWLGDDDPTPSLTPVFDQLASLSREHGTQVYFMHGNRDFLVGQKLAERCHFELLADMHKLNIGGVETLLLHGDTLCTDDVEYQKFRQLVRSEQWQSDILSKSLEERIQIAKNLRQRSKTSTAEKEEYIMDVNQEETDRTFLEYGVNMIIHGHTHRPAIHRKKIEGIERTRVVLGDWFSTGSYLRLNSADKSVSSDPVLRNFP